MNSIALPDLRVVTPWTASRSGTLLRVFLRDKGQLATGIRCKAIDKECIVALEGDAYGRLITEEDIAGPALDVSNLFELATSEDLLPPASGGRRRMSACFTSARANIGSASKRSSGRAAASFVFTRSIQHKSARSWSSCRPKYSLRRPR